METMTAKELLVIHNELAAAVGARTLKSWSKAKSLLIDRINELKAQVKPRVQRKAKRVTHASRIREMIVEGLTNAEIFDVMVKEFDSFDETKKWHIQWHRAEQVRKGNIRSTVDGQPFAEAA